jgi:hypothetical protein
MADIAAPGLKHRNAAQSVNWIVFVVSMDQCCGYGMFVPDPGVKKALDPGSRIRICNTATR